ncbi:MAG: hypothetical protein E5W91_30855 [Mesorhizobium sp.]|nr:MAG: hypothetical protein E5W91_30855 [Mesorhizobium sp.]
MTQIKCEVAPMMAQREYRLQEERPAAFRQRALIVMSGVAQPPPPSPEPPLSPPPPESPPSPPPPPVSPPPPLPPEPWPPSPPSPSLAMVAEMREVVRGGHCAI